MDHLPPSSSEPPPLPERVPDRGVLEPTISLEKPRGLHWLGRPGSWRLAILAVVIWAAIIGLNHIIVGEVAGGNARTFAFTRFASSVVLVLDQRHHVPEEMLPLLGLDDDSVREEVAKIFDQAIAADRLPPEALPEWVILLDRVGDQERSAHALEAVTLAEVSDDVRQQEELTGVLLDHRAGGSGQLAARTEVWLDQRIAEETWELPEWLYVAEVRNDQPTADWLAQRGRNIVQRGLAADLGYMLFFVVSMLAVVLMMARRPSGSCFRQSVLPDRWSSAALTSRFFYAEVVALFAVVVVALVVTVPMGESVASVFSMFAFLAVPIWMLGYRFFPGPRAMARAMGLSPMPFPAARLVLFTLWGVGLLLGLAALSAWILAPFTSELIEDTLTPTGLDWPGAILSEAFIAVVLAPIGEEILFRGFLYGGLSRKMNAFAAMAISSLVFAVSHQYSLTGLVFVFIYGLVFCWLYKRTGSLWPGILAHGLYNGLITWQGVAWYSFHG